MAGNYTHTTRSTGLVLTDVIYNADHNNHITNMTPAGVDDYSSNAAQMKTIVDPYPASAESLATSLAGELERIRYVLKQITGASQWYIDPVGLDSAIVSSSLTSVGTIGTGVWQGTSIGTSYTDAKVTSVSGSTGAVVDGDIDHDSLANFASNEHYTQANITATGTIASGVWNGTSIGTAYTDAKVTSVSGSTGAVTDGDIDHDSLANFASNEHYTQANITATGTVASGTWQGTAIDGTYIDLEGTEVKSTGEGGGNKYLREDGDGTCSWQAVAGGVTSVSGATGAVADGDIDHDQLANFASNEHYTQANITATGTIASGTWNGTSIGTAYTDAKVTSVSGSTGAVVDGDIDHDALANFASNEHYTQANITATGTIASGTWQGTAVDGTYVDLEGTELKSTGEGGGSKYLREDGDGTCSWQAVAGGVTSVSGSTGVVTDGDIDHDQLANFASNEHFTQANITATGTIASGTWNGTSIGTTYTDAKLADVVDDTSPTLGGALDCNDLEVGKAKLKDYGETLTTANTSTSYTIDLTNGNVFELTLTGNCVYTFSNPPATGIGGSFTLIQKQDGTGSRTVTFPASVEWAGGTAPTITSTASSVDIFTFITTDAGTTWYGFTAGQDFS